MTKMAVGTIILENFPEANFCTTIYRKSVKQQS